MGIEDAGRRDGAFILHPSSFILHVRLLLVTDRLRAPHPPVEALQAALSALPDGGAAVILREKDMPARDLAALARRLRAVAAPHRARVIVNGRVDAALAAGADGVHLGGDAPPVQDVRAAGVRFLVGVSLHGDERPPAGADYALLAPVFATPSKPGAAPLGLDALRRCAASPVPVFALGGVTPANTAACLAAGAHGVAVRGAILGSVDPARGARFFRDALSL